MIRAAGHTMATPDATLEEALVLLAEIGFEGVEIICADDYPCGLPTRPTTAQLTSVRSAAEQLGLAVANVVPYVRPINARDERTRLGHVDEMRRCLDIAAAIGSLSVRVWAGVDPEPGHETEQQELLVDSLRRLAGHAADLDVRLNVENHMGSHAISGAITTEIVQEVGSPYVGILYDPANLLVLGDADYQEAFTLQAPYIGHVHFKDVDVLGGGKHMPRLVGEGEVPWAWILPALAASGYSGFVSTEFEKRWHPQELPPSREGLQHELAQLRWMLSAPDDRVGA
ncbi:sugar phosphate isomerase/epimerase [Ruania alkalisoli]|uniref:Sugar phosphate isomerase/epimerase n=1 Tax=Ruania alkalisoli TaxID=2779775 RepID=A0A7M1SSN4_9MICO|nr:sugar phosphate isomerase/epimerase [Ruania alkalisoli]QOR70560.1 sugar phosphate isomerase/epimerase [Ruania alkalisoli]